MFKKQHSLHYALRNSGLPSYTCIVAFTLAFLAVLILLTGCSAQSANEGSFTNEAAGTENEGEKTTSLETTPASPSVITNETVASASEQGENMDTTIIQLDVNGRTLQATLENNSSAEAFTALLEDGPLTVTMNDYASMEKVGPLGTSLPRNDTQTTTSSGDLILYQGNQIVLYYDTNSWSFTRLGHVENVGAEELRAILGTGSATITFSLV